MSRGSTSNGRLLKPFDFHQYSRAGKWSGGRMVYIVQGDNKPSVSMSSDNINISQIKGRGGI